MKGISTALVLTFLSVSGVLFAFRSAPAFAQEPESCTVASPAPQAADVAMRVLDGIDGVARKIESIAPAAWEMMVERTRFVACLNVFALVLLYLSVPLMVLATCKLHQKYERDDYPSEGLLAAGIIAGVFTVSAVIVSLVSVPFFIDTIAAIRFPEIAAAKDIIGAATIISK